MIRTTVIGVALLFSAGAFSTGAFGASMGPANGSLLIVGGGAVGPELSDKFFELAGGKDQPIVVIPTADGAKEYDEAAYLAKTWLAKAGATKLILLHTADKAVADKPEFAAPLKTARAVWFVGGRQWHLVDSYLNTLVETELFALLKRGGVIGGSSAGATIMGSYLVRGAREGNETMMAKGYEEGLGLVKGVAIDQHIIARKREADMGQVVAAHPELLGIGINEGTAIWVRGDAFTVLGVSKVAITTSGKPYYFLEHGDRFDMVKRAKISETAAH